MTSDDDADYIHDTFFELAMDIRDTRRGMGWTQVELARRAGVSERTVRNVENFKFGRRPQVETIRKLADTLGATTHVFLGKTVVEWPREAISRGREIAWDEIERTEGISRLTLPAK